MRKSITIDIPEPCHEDWKKMTPKEQGRHCTSCNKTVIDFTKQTDEQVIKTFESSANICGRFKNQQLNREIVIARKDQNNYLSWAASCLFAFLAFGNQEIHAQGVPKTMQTDAIKIPQVKGKVATSILNNKVFSGKVTTIDDGLPLPGASVIVTRTANRMQTDFDGNFTIKAKLGDTLEFSYVGMTSQKIVANTNYKIDIAMDSDDCYDNVMVGYVSYYDLRTNDCNKRENKRLRAERKVKRLTKREAIRNGEQKRSTLGKFFSGIKSLFSKK